jgi:hypothetical protein
MGERLSIARRLPSWERLFRFDNSTWFNVDAHSRFSLRGHYWLNIIKIGG